PPDIKALDEAVTATSAPHDRASRADAFFRVLAPAADPHIATVDDLVTHVAATPGLVRVDDLARSAGLGMRAPQRLFADYVGVGPKWVIRRARIQEAAQRASSGGPVDWAELAADLRYSDQAHFIRDFTT